MIVTKKIVRFGVKISSARTAYIQIHSHIALAQTYIQNLVLNLKIIFLGETV